MRPDEIATPHTAAKAILSFLWAVGSIVALAMLVWAPVKLYAIHKELRKSNETMATHTRLLATIANAADPVEPK